MKSDCIFCRIIRGEIPAARVFEDADTLAFMDVNPLVEGHALVIPKTHHNLLTETPESILQACIITVRRLANAQLQALNADGVNLHQANGEAAGQAVPHLHFHVVPRFDADGHHWNWTTHPYASKDAMQELATRIGKAMPRP